MAKAIKKKPSKSKPACTPVCEVNNPDKNPFQTGLEMTLGAGMPIVDGFFVVPAGKRLVIEYISGQAFLPAGQTLLLSIMCRAQDDGVWHYLPATTIGRFGNEDCFQYGGLVRLYADPGSAVALQLSRDSLAGAGAGRVSLSGYLVSIP